MKAIKKILKGMATSLTAVLTGICSIYIFTILHKLEGWFVVFMFSVGILYLIFCLCLCYGIGDTSNKKLKEGAEE